jgi:anti-anti-sigma regulatory factor
MKSIFTWRFPSIISFFIVPKYLKTLETVMDIDTIIFDLTRTNNMHSSFTGFLLFAIDRLNNQGKDIEVKMSPYVRKTLGMLGMNDYLDKIEQGRKSA